MGCGVSVAGADSVRSLFYMFNLPALFDQTLGDELAVAIGNTPLNRQNGPNESSALDIWARRSSKTSPA